MAKPLVRLQFSPPSCHFTLGDSLVLDSGEVLVGFSDPRTVGRCGHRPKDRTNVVELINPAQPESVKNLRWTDEFSRCDKFLSTASSRQVLCLYGHRYNRNGLDILLPPGMEMTKFINFNTDAVVKSLEAFRPVGEYSLLPMQIVTDRLTFVKKLSIGPTLNYSLWEMTDLGRSNSTDLLNRQENWPTEQLSRVLSGVGLMFLRNRHLVSFERRLDNGCAAQFNLLSRLDVIDSSLEEIPTQPDPNHGYPEEISAGRFCAERFRLKSDSQLLLITGDWRQFRLWQLDMTDLSKPMWSRIGVLPGLHEQHVRIGSFGLSPDAKFVTLVTTKVGSTLGGAGELEILVVPLQPPRLFVLAEVALLRSNPQRLERDIDGSLMPPANDHPHNNLLVKMLENCGVSA